MAAAIVPVVLNAIAFAGPLIPPLVQFVESAFGPKTGPTRLDTVMNSLKALLVPMATAGTVAGVPSDAELKAAIEAVLANMKANGQLAVGAVAAPGAAAPGIAGSGTAPQITVPMQLVGYLRTT
jgi:hypothetical protein